MCATSVISAPGIWKSLCEVGPIWTRHVRCSRSATREADVERRPKGTPVVGPLCYSRYPSYKNSGVEWLGEIPAHWEVRRLKTLARVELSNVDKKSVEGEESVRLCNYTDVYYNERITGDLE